MTTLDAAKPLIGWDLPSLLALVEQQLALATDLRHDIHRNPDLSGEEAPTAERIIAALGVSDYQKVADTGLIVRVGPKEGPAIGIRAETDALPLREVSGVPFASQNGNMHACGHDVHIAGAVALARAAMQVDLPVALVFIFQPREEAYPSGAEDVMLSGLLSEHSVRSVLGVHVHPNVPLGSITTGAGVVNAASDEFRVTITGSGGHAAYPHKTTDPVVTLAQVITTAQTIASRRIDPMNPVVLGFGNLRAGDAGNVIPTVATAIGSIRTTNHEDRIAVERELDAIVRLVAEANGCAGSLEVTRGEPVLSNDEAFVSLVDPMLEEHGFHVIEPMRSCGSDDFSFYSDMFPSIMMFLGVGSESEAHSLHHPDFCPEDSAVHAVARALGCAYGAIASSAEFHQAPGL